MIVHYYHVVAMRSWELVFRVLIHTNHRPLFEWALNMAGGHAGWLMIESDELDALEDEQR